MENKIASLRISSYKTANKIELAQILLDFILILKKIKLSKTEKLVLSYFMVEGYSEISKEQVLTDKILHSQSSLANTLTVFRKQGILVKEKFKECLAPDFRIPLTEKVNINITLDNS